MEVEESNPSFQREETLSEEEKDYKIVKRVLAPFLLNHRKKKRGKTDSLPAVHKELYLKKNPKKLLDSLQTAFTDPIELKTLMNETAELLRAVTKSKSVNLYLTDYERGTIALCPKYYERNPRFERTYPIESGTYLAAHVAFTKEYVISSDILGDPRFPLGIPDVPVVKSVICLPIITNVEENCIGIIELYKEVSDKPYDLINLQICNALTAWMGIAVEQNKERQSLKKVLEIQKTFYDLISLYSSGAISFGQTISDFIKLTKATVNADKGALHIFRETVLPRTEDVLVADTYEEGIDSGEETLLFKKKICARFIHNKPGLAGYVARSGEVINIHNAYKDQRFDQASDGLHYKTQSIVAFPIKNEFGVIAVLELLNNLEYPHFRQEDITLIQSFLGYISLTCEYFFLSESFEAMKTKFLIAGRLIAFYSKPSPEEFLTFKFFMQEEEQFYDEFSDFEFYAGFGEEPRLKHILHVFLSSDVLKTAFEAEHLADFLLRIKKSFQPAPYHNFRHAFFVFVFTFITLSKIEKVFSDIEMVTMLLAALCHDIDHSGLTNGYLSLTNDPIYVAYGDCCGEAHRYELAVFLIQHTKLLSNYSDENVETIQNNLKKLILGFDLRTHFENRKLITELLNDGSFDWSNPGHRLLPQNMILICADYSVHFQNYDISKKFIDLFYKELFTQGNLEQSMGFSPLPVFSPKGIRSYARHQITLLSVVVRPVIELLIYLFPDLNDLEELFSESMEQWKELFKLEGHETWKISQAMVKDKRGPHDTRASTLWSSSIALNLMESEDFIF